MKKPNVISLLACAVLLITGCTSSSSDQARIAELEAKIAELQGNSEQSESASETSSQTASAQDESSSSLYSSSSSYSSYKEKEETMRRKSIGTYQLTDRLDHTWEIVLNEDGTATMGLVGGTTKAYASWEPLNFLDYNPHIEFNDERPIVWFPSGEEKPYLPVIIDGYFYLTSSAAKAKHPQKRLPIKKIK